MKEIGELCRKNKVFFHTDAAQVALDTASIWWPLTHNQAMTVALTLPASGGHAALTLPGGHAA